MGWQNNNDGGQFLTFPEEHDRCRGGRQLL